MFRCAIAFILLNIYYPSTGHPLKQSSTFTPLASQLQNLSNTCENLVLSDLIKKQIDHCNISDPADKKTEFECLMFYDINSQLCSVFRRSKINLEQNYNTKMNEIQDIKTICEHAKSWKFIYPQLYPKNEPVDQVFKKELFCIRICSVEDDILSSDSNFFCKYYQWGSQLMQSVTATVTSQNNGAPVPVYADSILNPVTNKTDISTYSKIDKGSTSTSESAVKPIVKLPEQHNLGVSEAGVAISDITNQSSIANETPAASPSQKEHELDNGHKITEQAAGSDTATLSRAEIEKPPVEVKPKNNEIADDTNGQQIENADGAKVDQQVVDVEDQEDDIEDESEYGQAHDQDGTVLKPMESGSPVDVQKPINDPETGLPQQSDGNISLLNSDPNMDITLHRNRVGIESVKSVAETFPNPMQDSFTEEDDHFFPFFLTAIIIVVLLYILYHNKNKFTKVILGLLVEGRQSNRRRNSRGHAYRRLDTLEQAMSTNTAAPPSKIIY